MRKAGAAEAGTDGRAVISGPWRFASYLAAQLVALGAPAPWLALPVLLVAAAGAAEGLRWGRWLSGNLGLLAVAALPAIAGFPWEFLGPNRGAAFPWSAWAPSLLRAARLAFVIASASWLSSRMSPVELRDSLRSILRPLGRSAAGRISRSASLAVSFIPWTLAELRQADEAARLRGSDPKRRPVRHLVALAVPFVSRSLDKAGQAADALSLRDPGFGA